MKKQILLLVMILLPLVASADAVEIDGIYYNLIPKGNLAEVTNNPNKYTGTVVIPESVTYENVNYSVTSIEDKAFQNCSSLTSITIPNSVTKIGVAAFESCRGLSSIIIPNSVTNIGNHAFGFCSSLTSVNIPNSVTVIGNYTFVNCSSLPSVTIPNSVTNIGVCAFASCSSLSSVNIPNSVTRIGGQAFQDCSSLTSVNIPNSVNEIGNYAFMGCSALTSVNIPNNVTIIGESAFKGCSKLTSVTIGYGIKTIYNEAFASCQVLTDVYCHAFNVPSTHIYAFNNSYIEYATLHVPAASINAYKTKEPWKNFKEIVSIEGGGTPDPQKCEKPTISYNNGQLKFASATDGAEFVSEITDTDIKKNYEATVTLTATYNISVYATKNGYDNSETATATLCWIDVEPKTEGITDGVAQIASKAVLIQSEGGILKVEGVDEGTQVAVYNLDGKQAGSGVSRNGAALVGTSIQPGNTAIVKIGERAVKLLIK